MLKWIGYSNNNIRIGKQKYVNILNDNFNENIDFKSSYDMNFSMYPVRYIENTMDHSMDITNLGNKTKHLIVSPDCFKESLMLF